MKKKKSNVNRINTLIKMLASQSDEKKLAIVLADLCSPAELEAMADRLFVLPMIADGLSYKRIHDKSGVSITTIGRVARHLRVGHGGYAELLNNTTTE